MSSKVRTAKLIRIFPNSTRNTLKLYRSINKRLTKADNVTLTTSESLLTTLNFRSATSYGGESDRRTKRQLEMPEIRQHTRCFSRAVERVHGQESQTGYKVQGQAVKGVTRRKLRRARKPPKLSRADDVGSGTAAELAESAATMP
jgi:hypothetical protein